LRISNCGFDKQTNPSSCDSRKFLLDAKQSELRNSKSELLFMDKSELEQRTKLFALRIVQFVGTLPENKVTNVLGSQLLKSGTSIGANYREANRAESRNDFVHKIGIVEKEASETRYWLELIHEADRGDREKRQILLTESSELLAIFTSIGRTAKRKKPECRIADFKSGDLEIQIRIQKFEIPIPKSAIPMSPLCVFA